MGEEERVKRVGRRRQYELIVREIEGRMRGRGGDS
jgi:hypothetical protein